MLFGNEEHPCITYNKIVFTRDIQGTNQSLFDITVRSNLSSFIRFYSTAEIAKSIPLPIPTMINSTAISIQLPSTPYLPPKDQWTYVQNHEVLFHRKGVEETPQKITVNEALPKTVIATGLKKYTEYVFYAHYFGTINGEDQNIITTYSAAVRTDEDGIYLTVYLLCNN